MVTIAMAAFARGGSRLRKRFLGVCSVLQVIYGDGRSFLREANGDSAPDALRRSGDEGVLPD
jgi:hypothetical protein